MQLKTNFWIEKDGLVALSCWRVELLEAIAETGSISAAAEKMGVSYRRAWDKIHECEDRLEAKLVDTQTGGVGGGGSQLTPAARGYIHQFHQLTDNLDSLAQQRFKQYFDEVKGND